MLKLKSGGFCLPLCGITKRKEPYWALHKNCQDFNIYIYNKTSHGDFYIGTSDQYRLMFFLVDNQWIIIHAPKTNLDFLTENPAFPTDSWSIAKFRNTAVQDIGRKLPIYLEARVFFLSSASSWIPDTQLSSNQGLICCFFFSTQV